MPKSGLRPPSRRQAGRHKQRDQHSQNQLQISLLIILPRQLIILRLARIDYVLNPLIGGFSKLAQGRENLDLGGMIFVPVQALESIDSRAGKHVFAIIRTDLFLDNRYDLSFWKIASKCSRAMSVIKRRRRITGWPDQPAIPLDIPD